MSVEIRGLDKLQKRLEEIKENAERLEGTNTVSFDDLFDQEFMNIHTEVSSFDEFLDLGNFNVHSPADFEAIPDDTFDEHVQKHSDFDSWDDMRGEATKRYIAKQLGF